MLDPKDVRLMPVSCNAFEYGHENTNDGRITVDQSNTPGGAPKHFGRIWFQGEGIVRRKNLPNKYNLWSINFKGFFSDKID